jgi:hypothetical protein
MDVEPDLDSVILNLDQPGDSIQHSRPMDIADTKIFDEDESFVFQSTVFDNKSKKLIIEKRDVKNKKGKSRSEVNLANMQLSQIRRLHRETKDSLDDSIGGIEAKNARLKDWVKGIGGSFDSYAIACQSFSNSHACHPCSQVKRILQPPRIV